MRIDNAEMLRQALKTASSQLQKESSRFQSERKMLEEKLAELERASDEHKKESRARKLAMRLVLDESVLRDIQEKTAAFLKKNLDVLEEAVDLNAESLAKIGEVDEAHQTFDQLERIARELK